MTSARQNECTGRWLSCKKIFFSKLGFTWVSGGVRILPWLQGHQQRLCKYIWYKYTCTVMNTMWVAFVIKTRLVSGEQIQYVSFRVFENLTHGLLFCVVSIIAVSIYYIRKKSRIARRQCFFPGEGIRISIQWSIRQVWQTVADIQIINTTELHQAYRNLMTLHQNSRTINSNRPSLIDVWHLLLSP